MRKYNIPPAFSGSLQLGRQGENGVTEITFLCAGYAKIYGDGFAEAVHRTPDGTTYPVNIEQDENNRVSWLISDGDTATAGTGQLELRWMVNGNLAKSKIFSTIIKSALTAPETPPDAAKSWVDKVLKAAEDIKASGVTEQKAREIAQSVVDSYQETDPTVPDWAKAETKPTYTAAEVAAVPDSAKSDIDKNTSARHTHSNKATLDNITAEDIAKWNYGVEIYITPQMFGAKGDGVADDTQAVQKAIEFCENKKNVLYIPAGVYVISDTLVLSKSIAIVGCSVHRGMLSANHKYTGISMLNFVAKSNATLVVAKQEAYDVSLDSLVFVSDTYSVSATGNVAVGSVCQKYYDYTKATYELNAVNIEKTVRCSIDNCVFSGFSGTGIITSQHKFITDCSFSHCNTAIRCTNYDNIIHHCWFCRCSVCIYSSVPNTLFLSDSWFDQIEQIAIKYDEGGFLLVDNCEFDMIDYCAIYSKQLYNSHIQGRFSRCGMYYGGFEPEDVPTEDEYKSCCIYSIKVATSNNIQAFAQRREIASGGGVAPSAFFGGAGIHGSNVILDIDENHIIKNNSVKNTNFVLSGKQYKARHTLRYNNVGCVSKDVSNPNGVYYSIDVGDIYISTAGDIYISVKKDSNADWVHVGSKTV